MVGGPHTKLSNLPNAQDATISNKGEMNQINDVRRSKIHWMDNGKSRVPMGIWSAIGRGWGSGPQHSQSVHGMLLGVPGLKIIMPCPSCTLHNFIQLFS